MLQRLKSKTYWAAIFMASMSIIEINMPILQPMLGDWYPLVYVGMSIAFMAIREATSKPLSEK